MLAEPGLEVGHLGLTPIVLHLSVCLQHGGESIAAGEIGSAQPHLVRQIGEREWRLTKRLGVLGRVRLTASRRSQRKDQNRKDTDLRNGLT